MFNLLTKFAKGKYLLLFFVILILFELLFMKVLTPRFLEFSGGVQLLDTTLFYSPEQAQTMVADYGSAGRSYYNYIQLADLFFPVVYALLLALSITKLISSNNLRQSHWRWVALIPLIAGVCDWLENIGIFTMLRLYPRDFGIVATITNLACILKFGGIGLSILMIFFLGTWNLIRKLW